MVDVVTQQCHEGSSCLFVLLLAFFIFSFDILYCKMASIALSYGYKSLGPHGLQPTRLLRPWSFPGKSTGVGCHFLLQQCRRPRFNSWVRKIPWRREWPPVFLPREFHELGSLLEAHSPSACKELDTTQQVTYTHANYRMLERNRRV